MAEQKKRGFHALEQRIHQIEEEDKKREASGHSEQQRPSQEQRAEQGQPKPRK